MLKIRRSHDRLIFNMGISIPAKDGLYIEMGPRLRSGKTLTIFLCPLPILLLPNGLVSPENQLILICPNLGCHLWYIFATVAVSLLCWTDGLLCFHNGWHQGELHTSICVVNSCIAKFLWKTYRYIWFFFLSCLDTDSSNNTFWKTRTFFYPA